MNRWFYKLSSALVLICFVTPSHAQAMFHALSVKNDGGVLEESICDWTGVKTDDPTNCRVLRKISPASIHNFVAKIKSGKAECEVADATDAALVFSATASGAIMGAFMGLTPVTLGRALLRGSGLTAAGLLGGLFITAYFAEDDCPSMVEKLMTRFYVITVMRVPDGFVRTEKIPEPLYTLLNQ
jgi:hypothetical protein